MPPPPSSPSSPLALPMDHDVESVTRHVQRLQLGALHRRPRRRPPLSFTASSTAASATPHEPHAALRRVLARSFQCPPEETYYRATATGHSAPVFQVAFGDRSARTRHLLAAADEDGVVAILDTSSSAASTRSPSPSSTPRISIYQAMPLHWRAHDNAIFDVAWAQDDTQLLTAAGDAQVRCWDVETRQKLFTLADGHTMSVKCVRAAPSTASTAPALIASGGRDGHVLLWDSRASSAPVTQLWHVHGDSASSSVSASPSSSSPAMASFLSPRGGRGGGGGGGRGGATHKRRRTSVGAPRSVTCVAFGGDGSELLTAGAVDATVKVWDLRRATGASTASLRSFTPPPMPVRELHAGGAVQGTNGGGRGGGGIQRGVTALALDASRSRLLVSMLSHELRVFDVRSEGAAAPLQRCHGHAANSFYVKATFSPDGDFIASGSGDGVMYVWGSSRGGAGGGESGMGGGKAMVDSCAPLLAFKGHDSEVNSVAWHGSDFTRLATSSDDGTVRVWRADRGPLASSSSSSSSSSPPSSSTSFRLRRRRGSWTNWTDFERQPDGQAYLIDEEEMKEDPKQEEEEEKKKVRKQTHLHASKRMATATEAATPERKRARDTVRRELVRTPQRLLWPTASVATPTASLAALGMTTPTPTRRRHARVRTRTTATPTRPRSRSRSTTSPASLSHTPTRTLFDYWG